MKKFFPVLIFVMGVCPAFAQLSLRKPGPDYHLFYATPNPYIVDTLSIKKLNDKFYSGKARVDNMPVLLPYGTPKMPNAGGGKETERMPNAWKRPSADSTDHLLKQSLFFPKDAPAIQHYPGRSKNNSKQPFRQRKTMQ